MAAPIRFSLLALVLTLWFSPACVDPDPPRPKPDSVTPDHMVQLVSDWAQPVDISIRGEDLAMGLQVDIETGEISFEGEFQVFLNTTALSDVQPRIEEDGLAIGARVPSDLNPGIYDLTIEAPTGQRGVLVDAFEVRTIETVSLSAESDPDPPVAGNPVTVTVRLLDNRSEPVSIGRTDDLTFSLDTGSGQFRPALVVDGEIQVIYDTATTPEGALVRATEHLSGTERSGTLLLDSRSGSVAGLRLELEDPAPVAGQVVGLNAYLEDTRGNVVPAAVVADVAFALVQGTGGLGSAEVVGDHIRIEYATHTMVEEVVVRAIEAVSGNGYVDQVEFTTIAGTPSQLALSASNANPVAGDPVTINAELQDANANPIPFAAVDDFLFRLIDGRGLLSAPALFAGQGVAIYSTYRRIETAVVQVEESVYGGITPAQIAITSIGGSPVGVGIFPGQAQVGAGQSVTLAGWLTDTHGNQTAAATPADITFALTGNGSLGATSLVSGAVQVAYTAAGDPVPDQATVTATEQVTGNGLISQAQLSVVAGPVESFDVEPGFASIPAGTPFNLQLTARDAFGHVASGFTGSVTLGDSTGTIAPPTSGAFDAGTRTVNATISLTQLGVQIQVGDSQGHTGTSLPFDVVGGGIDRFEIDPIGDQIAGVPFDITIRALDELGNPIESYAGSAILTDNTGTIQPALCNLFALGECTTQIALTAAHPAAIVGAHDGAGHTGTSNSFTVAADAPATLAFTSLPQNLLPDQASAPLEFQVRDTWDNPSPVAAPISLDLASSSPSGRFDTAAAGPFDGSVTTVDVLAGTTDGLFYYRDNSLGDHLIDLSDPGGSLTGASQTLKVSDVGDPTRVRIITAPASVTAGTASGVFVVQLQDAGGSAVLGHPPVVVDLVSANPGGRFDVSPVGLFDGTVTSLTIPNGTSDANFYYRDTLASPVRIDATSPGLVGDIWILQVSGGPVVAFDIEPIADQQAGQPFQILVTARDNWDNVADGFVDTVVFSDLSATISPAVSGPFSGGTRTEQMSVFGAIDPDRLSVDDGFGHLGTSNEFRVAPGPVDHFDIAPVTSPQTAGQPFDLSISARDAWNNQAAGFIGVVNLIEPTNTISPPVSATFVAGLLTQSVALTRSNTAITITADDGQNHTGSTNPFAVLAGPLDHFEVGPTPAIVAQGSPFDLPMEARDIWENRVETFSGTVDLIDLTGTIQPTTSGAFLDGSRLEQVTIDQLQLDDRITADDLIGHTGESNLFDVVDPQPAELSAEMEDHPSVVVEGEGFEVHLVVTNLGDFVATGVSPVDYTDFGPGSATLVNGPTPASADIPGRATQVYVWTYTTDLGDSGVIWPSGRAEGTDSQAGGTIQSNFANSTVIISPASCLLNPVTVDAGPAQLIACGESVTLGGTPTASGGVGSLQYDWLPGAGLDDSTIPNPLASPDSNTAWDLSVTDAIGCQDWDTTSVALSDGPTAAFTVNPPFTCTGDQVTFDAGQSTGGVIFSWDFGDGNQDNGTVVSHSFGNRGWYPVTLTVEDALGCRSQVAIPISISGGDEPAGRIFLTLSPATIPADGSSMTTATSLPITECDGDPIASGKAFTVLATRGRILSPDQEGGAGGIQVRTQAAGTIQIEVEADRPGGVGRLLVMTRRNDLESRGWVDLAFSGSSSLPQVVDFGPSGEADLAVPRFVVRFDKPMDPASLATAFVVQDGTGPVPGQVSWDAHRLAAVFAPDVQLDPISEVYTITIADSALDSWGNPLDGNFNGLAEAGLDGFSWTFGDLNDNNSPGRSCQGLTENPFSPDGDTDLETTTLEFDAWDNEDLWLAQLGVLNAAGRRVKTLLMPLPATGSVSNATIPWDGRDTSGLLVDNGIYTLELKVFDTAGNPSSTCNESVQVDSALDPAAYP